MDSNNLSSLYYASGILYYVVGVLVTLSGIIIFVDIDLAIDWSVLISVALVVIAGAGGVFGIYVLVKSIEIRNSIGRKSDGLDFVLKEFLFPRMKSEYHGLVSEPSDVRVAVVLSERRFLRFPPGRRELSIVFDDDQFTPLEREIDWKKGDSMMERALNRKTQEAWWNVEEELLEAIDPSPEKEEVLKKMSSALAVPLYVPEDEQKLYPIGCLYVDSDVDIEESGFSDPQVREHFIKYANVLGAML